MLAAPTRQTNWLLFSLLLVACGIFLTGISWGLPSHAADPFLFGDRTPWTAKQILALAPDWGDDANRAADVAAHPLANRDRPIILNQTDTERAAIVRRYRLYSDQPDEMITLRAIAQMKPGKLQLDPKLYQYGGLWIYPIAILLKVASKFNLVFLTADLGFYLDHPETFGRFYVAMRLYSAAWGLVGVLVMFGLAERISGSQFIGYSAAICFMLLPTVVNGAHEAKPHLAGAVLQLIAVALALQAVQSGQRRWVIAAGVACGAAASMVMTGGLSICILPVMAWLMRFNDPKGLPSRGDGPTELAEVRYAGFAANVGVALVGAGATYAICNPYVIVHLLGNHAVLRSNLENSAAMYQAAASIGGVVHGIRLSVEGGSPIIFFGMGAIVFHAWRRGPIAWLLLAATVPAICIFLMRATEKPAEYGRFAIAADVMLVVGGAVGMSALKRPIARMVAAIILCLIVLPFGFSYVLSYGRETFGQPTRLIAAIRMQELMEHSAGPIAVDADPAPYVLPPVDLQKNEIVLLPRDSKFNSFWKLRINPADYAGTDQPTVQYLIRPLLLPTPISWAGKPFRIEMRPDGESAAKGRR